MVKDILVVGNNKQANSFVSKFENTHNVFQCDGFSLDKSLIVDKSYFVTIICIETSMDCKLSNKSKNFKFDTFDVEEILNLCSSELILIFSNLEPGTIERFKIFFRKNIVCGLEEKNLFFFGGSPDNTREISNLFIKVYGKDYQYVQTNARTCETFNFLKETHKVIQKEFINECNYLCNNNGVDFTQIREMWMNLGIDPLEITEEKTNKNIKFAFYEYLKELRNVKT